MIVEVAEFTVKPEDHGAFEEALSRGVRTVLSQAAGYISHRILGGIETTGRVLLVVEWRTVEDHMVGFRESAHFAEWRAIISPFFTQPARMEHFSLAN